MGAVMRAPWIGLAGLGLAWLLLGGPAAADMSGPAPEPTGKAPPSRWSAAEQEFNRGLAAQQEKQWAKAAAAFQSAVRLNPRYAEAWNGLGFALRNQGKYPESIKAYDQALRLRPDFPEALGSLGEAYVRVRRIDDARQVLDRLKPLDPKRAAELADVIEKGK
jgi:tetratricopeptide (TPR) repeat protein